MEEKEISVSDIIIGNKIAAIFRHNKEIDVKKQDKIQ